MAEINIRHAVHYDHTTCCNCGVSIIIEAEHLRVLRENHEWFYCLNGHRQHYTGKTDADKLREELEREKKNVERERLTRQTIAAERDYQTRRASAYMGKLTRVKKRVANGVCPCCNRTFRDLAAHMTTKHPGWGAAADPDTE